ncbi:MAG: alpha/beta hydrolase, partial [Myxococcaceae bacterium]|nr:alpha/beta hydrolase [Myxococcaceae bacterium]
MIPKPGETGMAWGRNTRASAARRRYYQHIRLSRAKAEDETVIYYHDLPKALAADAKRRTFQQQSMTPMEQPWPLKKWPDVPTHVISGRDDRMLPLALQRRVARERLGVKVEVLDGGHMLALSQPKKLAAKLEELRVSTK